MKFSVLTVLTIINLTVFGQNATELNFQSKKLIVTQNFTEAVPLLKKAAKLGNAEAQYNLGVTLEYGYGINKNLDSAFVWYFESAQQGWNDALYKMMMAHSKGIHAEQSNDKAFIYALKCAENNDITCMFNIVGAYRDGFGTQKNLVKMLNWAIRIGKLKTPENLMRSGKVTSTRLHLAYMYRDGQDVKQDSIMSYSWFLIYNESKRDFSILRQQSVIKEILELENKLTEDEIELAIKQAINLIKRPLVNIDKLHETNK